MLFVNIVKCIKITCALAILVIVLQSTSPAAGSIDHSDRGMIRSLSGFETPGIPESEETGIGIDEAASDRTIASFPARDLGGYRISGNGVLIGDRLTTKQIVSGIPCEVGGILGLPDNRSVTVDNIAAIGSDHFCIYSRIDGKEITISIIHSNDSGESWSDPVDVASKACDNIIPGLHIWNGELFAFYSFIKIGKPENNDLLVKSVPLDSWTNIGSLRDHKLVDGYAKEFTVIDDGSDLYVVLYRDILKHGIFLKYDGDRWTSDDKVIPSGSCESVSMQKIEKNGTAGISIFMEESESTAYGKDHVRIITSFDNGDTWEDTAVIKTVISGNGGIQTLSIDGSLQLFWANRTAVFSTTSYDSGENWSEIRSVAEVGSDGTIESFSTSTAGNDTIYLAFLDSGSDVNIIYSDDCGRSWLSHDDRLVVNINRSGFPVLSSIDGLFTFSSIQDTTTNLRLGRIGRGSSDCILQIDSLYFPALSEWNDIGMNCGIEENCSISITLLNGSSDEPVHDGSVSVDASSLDGGVIQGAGFGRILKFQDEWERLTGVHPLSIMIEMNGSDRIMPWLSVLVVNYTTDFPFHDDLETDRNIHLTDLQGSDGSLTVPVDAGSGSMITRVIEKEEDWPDLLTVNLTAGEGDTLRVGLLNENGDPIPGYTLADSKRISGINGSTYASWAGKELNDLPGDVSRIRIIFVLESAGDPGSPVIHGYGIEANSPPKIETFEYLPSSTIIRSETVELLIGLDDDIDPIGAVDPQIEYRKPGEEDWIPWEISECRMNAEGYIFDFPTDENTEVGEWDFRARASDSLGSMSDYFYAPQGLVIFNSIPTAPVISVFPKNPTTESDVIINIMRPASDIDYPDIDLSYLISWIRNGESVLEEEGSWNSTPTLSRDLTRKGDFWEVSVAACDDRDISGEACVSFEIINAPPVSVRDEDLIIRTQEDRSSEQIDFSEFFIDPDGDDLEYTVFPGSNITPVISGSRIHFIPKPDWYGEGEVHVRASDGIGSDYVTALIIVEEVNDPPIINGSDDLVLGIDRWNGIWFDAWDPLDNDDVFISTDMSSVIPGLEYPDNYHFDHSGFIRIIPDGSMIGRYEIEVAATDSRGGVTTKTVSVRIVDDGGSDVPLMILTPDDGAVGYIGDLWNFTGYAGDEIDIDGGAFSLVWYIDGSLAGTGDRIENISLVDGEHLVTLSLKLDGREITSTGIIVYVLPNIHLEKTDSGMVDDQSDGARSAYPSSGDDERLLIDLIIGMMVVILLTMFIILGIVVYKIRSDSTGGSNIINMYQPRPSLPKGDIHFRPDPPALPPYRGDGRRK